MYKNILYTLVYILKMTHNLYFHNGTEWLNFLLNKNTRQDDLIKFIEEYYINIVKNKEAVPLLIENLLTTDFLKIDIFYLLHKKICGEEMILKRSGTQSDYDCVSSYLKEQDKENLLDIFLDNLVSSIKTKLLN